MKSHKLFCIGFQKTGTSSLGKALNILGYRVCGYNPFRTYAQLEDLTWDILLEKAEQLTQEYDAFKDTPWPIFYREFDQKYPNSKFILVIRDTPSWINSAVKDFENYPNYIHQLIYGVPYPQGNESVWIERYERHNREVIDYFKDRSDDFLLLNLDHNEVYWEKICDFLDLEVPEQQWPKINTRREKKSRLFMKRCLKKLVLIPNNR